MRGEGVRTRRVGQRGGKVSGRAHIKRESERERICQLVETVCSQFCKYEGNNLVFSA